MSDILRPACGSDTCPRSPCVEWSILKSDLPEWQFLFSKSPVASPRDRSYIKMLHGSPANGPKRLTDAGCCGDTSVSCLIVTAVCLASMFRQIGSRYISQSCSYEDV